LKGAIVSWEGVKAHVKRHQVAYSVGAVIVVAGITYYIVRSSIAQRGIREGLNAQRGLTNTASYFSFGNKQTINITTVLDREGRGHPGWPVRNLEFKKVFFSQREAANTFDISEGILSLHLQGKLPDAGGLHFERVNLVPSQN